MNRVQEASAGCPICEKIDVTFVADHTDFPGKRIWFCSSCNHWFSYPEPTHSELDHHYECIYSHRRKSYFGESYYLVMEHRADAQIHFITKNIVKSGGPNNLRGLESIDWGCGLGALVSLEKKEGADAIGFDSDPEVISTGKSLWKANIETKKDFDLRPIYGKYDLLTLSHVIEHLSDIRESLKVLFKVLKPGGYVFVEVPNCYAKMFAKDMDMESHLHFFSKQSLTFLIGSLGVQVLDCVSCGPPNKCESNAVLVDRSSKFLRLVGPLLRPLKSHFKHLVSTVLGSNKSIRCK